MHYCTNNNKDKNFFKKESDVGMLLMYQEYIKKSIQLQATPIHELSVK